MARRGTPITDAAERETVITWSDADQGLATIYTSQRTMVTRLRRVRGAERIEVHRTDRGDWTGETWRVPVAAVLPRNPAQRRFPVLSEAQRRQNTARLLASRKRPSMDEKLTKVGHSSERPDAP